MTPVPPYRTRECTVDTPFPCNKGRPVKVSTVSKQNLYVSGRDGGPDKNV